MGLRNVNIQCHFAIAGETFEPVLEFSGNDWFATSYSVPAAKAGTLTTRTDNDTGELTMGGGHGIVDGDRLDLYWTGGCRRGMVVGVVAGNAVPIDGGSGDNLPAQDTAIVASVPVEASFPVTVADVHAIGAKCDYESQFTFLDDDGTTENHTMHVEPDANGDLTSAMWADGFSAALAGTLIATVFLSHADTAAAHTMTVGYMAD